MFSRSQHWVPTCTVLYSLPSKSVTLGRSGQVNGNTVSIGLTGSGVTVVSVPVWVVSAGIIALSASISACMAFSRAIMSQNWMLSQLVLFT